MQDNLTMTCAEVNKRLKQFLEDLLAEEEYQAFFNHLESCLRCKNYVSSFGSLSNQLWELGNLKVPSDFSSTVLFKLKQSEQEIKTPQFIVPKKVVIGILIFVVGALSVFFGIRYLKTRKHTAIDETPIVSMQVIREQQLPDAHEAESFLEESKDIAKGLGAAPAESSNESKAALLEPKPLHWHIIYSEEAEKTKLLDTLNALGIKLDYQTPELLVFSATGDNLDRLLAGIQFTTILKNFTPQTPTFLDRKSRVSIYLKKKVAVTPNTLTEKKEKAIKDNKESLVFISGEKKDTIAPTTTLHWHILFILPKKQEVLDLIRQLAGSIDYESEELLIFSISGRQVGKLIKQIQALEGVFADFGYTEFREEQLMENTIRISIYFSRK